MSQLDAAGHQIVMHIHDEVVLPPTMTRPRSARCAHSWPTPQPGAKGLPLNADGYEYDFYMKD
ncbi:hypothetical protein [Devriesea agamarum]|uniref:hypothetical protein n=1 Tax=Devriesea agamarum TaxID=472569 RepID=UPI0018D32A95|nr:hypothetical protein [Devriesea agamarum]